MKQKLIVLSLISALFLSSCSNSKSYQRAIEKKIEEKYKITCTASEIVKSERLDIFDSISYKSTVTDESGNQFTVGISSNKKTIYDNYAKVLFDQEICKREESIQSNHPSITFSNVENNYPLIEEKWNTVDEYLSNNQFNESLNIALDTYTIEESANEIHSLCEDLINNNLNYMMDCDCTINGQMIQVSFITLSLKTFTYDEIYSKLVEELEDV